MHRSRAADDEQTETAEVRSWAGSEATYSTYSEATYLDSPRAGSEDASGSPQLDYESLQHEAEVTHARDAERERAEEARLRADAHAQQ